MVSKNGILRNGKLYFKNQPQMASVIKKPVMENNMVKIAALILISK